MDGQRAIARRLVIGLPPDGVTPAWERDFAMYPPGGVIVFARDFRDLDGLRRLTTRLRDLARPRRIFLALDEEGGWVSQLAGHAVVPPNAALLARGAEPGDVAWVAEAAARRLRALGFDWNFAPVADVHSRPENPVIGPRAWGTTPEAASHLVAEVLRGFRAARLGSCLKHFPGHGDTRLDSHLELAVCDADARTLDARELAPFRANLAAADSVMTAHVVFPALDAARPATFSHAIVSGLLRDRLGFGGVVVTDALEMRGAAEGRTLHDAGRDALEAGCDLLMWAHHDEDVRRARLTLADALVEGGLDRAAFDAGPARLAAFAQSCPVPGAEELARPLDALVPAGWDERLERIARRGLLVTGRMPAAAGPWHVDEPAFAHGPTLADSLRAAGVRVTGPGEPATAQVIAIASRRPLPPEVLASLRARCLERPTVMVGLQNDAFLDSLPEAALRLSASDATPLVRRVVAERLAALAGAARA